MKKIIQSSEAPDPIGPYNQAVLAGDFLYISGQIPYCQKTQQFKMATIEEATQQVMQNIGAILKEAQLDFTHIIKTTIYVKNLGDFDAINRVYGTYFDEATAPARACVEVSALPKGVPVEIEAIAYTKK